MPELPAPTSIEVYRAILSYDDCTQFAEYGSTWTPLRERAEWDARQWTSFDATRPYVQVGWISLDVLDLDDSGYLADWVRVDEGPLIPVAGWFDDDDREVLSTLHDVGADTVATVYDALLSRAVRREREVLS